MYAHFVILFLFICFILLLLFIIVYYLFCLKMFILDPIVLQILCHFQCRLQLAVGSWQHAQDGFSGEFRDVAPITTNLLTKQINPISGQQQLRLAKIIATTTITMKVAG